VIAACAPKSCSTGGGWRGSEWRRSAWVLKFMHLGSCEDRIVIFVPSHACIIITVAALAFTCQHIHTSHRTADCTSFPWNASWSTNVGRIKHHAADTAFPSIHMAARDHHSLLHDDRAGIGRALLGKGTVVEVGASTREVQPTTMSRDGGCGRCREILGLGVDFALVELG
jgi:hypothetical protein